MEVVAIVYLCLGIMAAVIAVRMTEPQRSGGWFGVLLVAAVSLAAWWLVLVVCLLMWWEAARRRRREELRGSRSQVFRAVSRRRC
jgi:uncharacterized membrane protein